MNKPSKQLVTPRFGDMPHHPITQSPNHQIGFTLTELLVVIGIIVLLMAVGLPSIRAMFASSRLDSAYTLVSSSVSAARTYAPRMKGGVGPELDQEAMGAAAIFIQNADGQIEIHIAQHRSYSDAAATPPTKALYRDVLDSILLGDTVGVAGITRDSSGTHLILPPNPSTTDPFGFAIRFDVNGMLLPHTPDNSAADVWYNVNPPTATSGLNKQLIGVVGIIIFDRQAFQNEHPTAGYPLTAPETAWITQYGTPMLFNRYTGTVMKEQ